MSELLDIIVALLASIGVVTIIWVFLKPLVAIDLIELEPDSDDTPPGPVSPAQEAEEGGCSCGAKGKTPPPGKRPAGRETAT